MFTDRMKTPKSDRRQKWLRIAVVGVLILIISTSHWITPTSVSNHYIHVFHIVFSKLYVVPIILAAIWFEIGGAVLAVTIISLLYLPHIFVQWSGQTAENVNQVGEVATFWITAIAAGVFVRIEKEALREVAKTHEGSVLALVAALDAREHHTELHCLRVMAYALRIAQDIDLDSRQMQTLVQGSLLHDIGKIGTPDGILLKPGPLNSEEWHIMRQHSEIGHKVLLSVPFLKDAAEIVYCHHEHYDGSGYPRKLSGEQIPLGSRIFAVADVFDALNSDRPYRKKMSYEEAKAEIVKEGGTILDPRVVGAFIRISSTEWTNIEKKIVDRAAYLTGQNSSSLLYVKKA